MLAEMFPWTTPASGNKNEPPPALLKLLGVLIVALYPLPLMSVHVVPDPVYDLVSDASSNSTGTGPGNALTVRPVESAIIAAPPPGVSTNTTSVRPVPFVVGFTVNVTTPSTNPYDVTVQFGDAGFDTAAAARVELSYKFTVMFAALLLPGKKAVPPIRTVHPASATRSCIADGKFTLLIASGAAYGLTRSLEVGTST
jgi:hypothetical protein